MIKPTVLSCLFTLFFSGLSEMSASVIVDLWPGTPPGDEGVTLPLEADQTKDTDKLIAGRRIIKLGNVAKPQIEISRPSKAKHNGAAMIVAPGGGHHILAYDLEGTEVAEWLNYVGVTAIVLKYRVPSRDPDGERRWLSAVQDAQRAMSLVRGMATELEIDPERIGIMGFSAGGQTAALTALLGKRQYSLRDSIDQIDYRPNFVGLIYTGGMVPRGETALYPSVSIPGDAPPFFMVHADNDHVTPLNSALLYVELKKRGVSTELHIFERGGHGYGLRETDNPITRWPRLMESWMRQIGMLEQ